MKWTKLISKIDTCRFKDFINPRFVLASSKDFEPRTNCLMWWDTVSSSFYAWRRSFSFCICSFTLTLRSCYVFKRSFSLWSSSSIFEISSFFVHKRSISLWSSSSFLVLSSFSVISNLFFVLSRSCYVTQSWLFVRSIIDEKSLFL